MARGPVASLLVAVGLIDGADPEVAERAAHFALERHGRESWDDSLSARRMLATFRGCLAAGAISVAFAAPDPTWDFERVFGGGA